MARSKTADVLEQLYAAEPDEFVPERKRLERLLRDEGRPQEAAELAKLRKPALPVSAANRLARERADEVAKLVAAGEGLASGHRSGDAEELRGAQRELTERVATLVRGAQLSGAMEQRLATLLRAAATDPDGAKLLRRGVLSEEVEPTAFDALAGVKVARSKRRPAATGRERSAAEAQKRRSRIDELEREVSRAKAVLRDAERQVAAAEKERDRAARRVDQLTEQLDKARTAV